MTMTIGTFVWNCRVDRLQDAEELRLMAVTGSPISVVQNRCYEHIRAGATEVRNMTGFRCQLSIEIEFKSWCQDFLIQTMRHLKSIFIDSLFLALKSLRIGFISRGSGFRVLQSLKNRFKLTLAFEPCETVLNLDLMLLWHVIAKNGF